MQIRLWVISFCFPLFALAVPSLASAQEFCSRALADRPFPRLRNAIMPLEGGEMRPLVWDLAISRTLGIDSLYRGLIHVGGPVHARDSVRGRNSIQVTADYFSPEPEWFSDSADFPDSIRRLEPKDSVRRWDFAFQLADLFNGGVLGGTGGTAYAAASLYNFWHLPASPAAAFLADPAFSAAARSRAVRALESSWGRAPFREAAAAAFCTLAAKAAGLSALNAPSDSSELWMDYEEYQLFTELIWALGSVEDNGGPSAKDVIALLPPRNALTRSVTELLRR